MTEKPALRAAVVGRNVSAALWLEAVRGKSPHVSWSWYPTEDERTKAASPFWIVAPDFVQAEAPVPGIESGPIFLFLRGSRRVPILDFLEHGDLRHGLKVPLPVRRKLVASALFSDLSPLLWKRGTRGIEPDARWTLKSPASLEWLQTAKLWLWPRSLVLKYFEERLAQNGVSVAPSDCGVLGVEPGHKTEPHKLVHNAPHGFTSIDRILWTSFMRRPKDEGARKGRIKGFKATPLARWQSRGLWVDSSQVSALPKFSVWMDPAHEEALFATGILRSGELKRVLCVDGAHVGGPEARSWLQIEELVFAPFVEPSHESPPSNDFLYEICPGLKTQTEGYVSELLDENLVFENPFPKNEKLGAGVEAWYRAFLGSPAEAAQKWYQANAPTVKKPKRTDQAAQP